MRAYFKINDAFSVLNYEPWLSSLISDEFIKAAIARDQSASAYVCIKFSLIMPREGKHCDHFDNFHTN